MTTTTAGLIDLSGKAAYVTGAGQGIGEAIAHSLAAHGAAVAVNDHVPERAEAVADKIKAQGGTAVSSVANVVDLAMLQHAIETAETVIGPVNILVNNAGNAGVDPSVVTGRPFWETEPEEWDAFLGVNLLGVLNTCRAALPAMVASGHGGRVVTIISDAARVGEPGLEAYSAAKAGAAGLMRALARSLGRFQITANCIAVAATRTPTTEAALADEERTRKALRSYVIRRPGEPADVAGLAAFLASDSASWITGQTYPVNGGFSFGL